MNMHATTEQLLEIKDGLQNGASQHVSGCDHCQNELKILESIGCEMFAAADQQPRPESWARIEQALVESRADSTPAAQWQSNSLMASAASDTNNFENDFQNDFENDIKLEESGIGSSAGDVTPRDVPVELLIANSAQTKSNFNNLSKAIYSLAASIMVTGFIGLFVYGQQSAERQQSELLQANIQELMLNSRAMELAYQNVALQTELLTTAEQTEAERLYWRISYLDQMIHDNNVNSQSNPERVETLWNDRIEALTELNKLYFQRQQTMDDSEI